MIKQTLVLFFLFFSSFSVTAQNDSTVVSLLPEMVFVSDTQQPLCLERIFRKSNHNIKATAAIFDVIIKQKPKILYMLGDVVSLGYDKNKWKKVDLFLGTSRSQGTTVFGLLGNHDVMWKRKKGEMNFQKRFPMMVRTGYVTIADSVATILLNSNFTTLSDTSINSQQEWYKATLAGLDTTEAIKAIIVCCHHAPYSNSKIVGCSGKVLRYFVPGYIKSKKAKMFITGHAHAFEHFKMYGKDFLVIGGGGGLYHPLDTSVKRLPDVAMNYKPAFHYLSVKRIADKLLITSYFLKNDFVGFDSGYNFNINL
ncbi:MAG: metallophosphoesterase [Ferruginibacter sp.]